MTEITVQSLDRVLSALDELLDDHPELESGVDFYEEVLPMMEQARPSLDGLALNTEAVHMKLAEGVPLLWGEFGTTNTVGSEPNVDLFMTLCRLVSKNGDGSGETLMRAFLEGEFDLKEMLAQALVYDDDAVEKAAETWAVSPAVLQALSRFMLTPITRAHAEAFAKLLEFDRWQQGYCPVCGAWPILAELRGRDKLCYLCCGRCHTTWKHRRLKCVWCRTTDKAHLSFLYEPEQHGSRIDVCDNCKGYVKTIITFDPLDPDMLLVHDLATTMLDQMANEMGYYRPRRRPLA